jgi:hypothetical protein
MRGWNTGLAGAPGVGGAPGAAMALGMVRALGKSARQTALTNEKSSIFARDISRPSLSDPHNLLRLSTQLIAGTPTRQDAFTVICRHRNLDLSVIFGWPPGAAGWVLPSALAVPGGPAGAPGGRGSTDLRQSPIRPVQRHFYGKDAAVTDNPRHWRTAGAQVRLASPVALRDHGLRARLPGVFRDRQQGAERGGRRRQVPSDASRSRATIDTVKWRIRLRLATSRDRSIVL